VDPDNSSSYSGCTKDKVKCDSISLTLDSTLRLSRQIRDAKAKREQARVVCRQQLDALLKAKAALESAKRQEALLKNRHSKLIRQGLQSLEVGPDNPPVTSGVPSSEPLLTQDPVLDPSLFEGLPS